MNDVENPRRQRKPTESKRTRLEVFATLQLALPALLAAGLLCGLPLSLLNDAYPTWTSLVADSLLEAGAARLERLAAEKADLVTSSMQYYSANSALLGDFYARILLDEVGFNDDVLLPTEHGMAYGTVDLDYQPWTDRDENPDERAFLWAETDEYTHDAVAWPTDLSELPDDVYQRAVQSAINDVAFEPIYKAGLTSALEYVDLVYLVTEADGAWRSEPYYEMPWFADWTADESAYEYRPDLCPVGKTGYDGRCRKWYAEAKDAAEPTPSFYVFTSGVLGSSYSTPLFLDYAEPEGVIGLDLSMSFFSAVTDTDVTAKGYGVIFDANGLVMSHAELDTSSDAPYVTDFLLEDASATERAVFDALVVDPALQGDSGAADFSLGGSKWRIAWEPVYNEFKALQRGNLASSHIESKLFFVVAFAAPVSDLVAGAAATDDELAGELGAATGLLVTVAVAAVLVLAFALWRVLHRLGRPLAVASQLLLMVHEGRIADEDADVPESCQEMRLVGQALNNLSTAVGFAHELARAGDLAQAKTVYQRGLKLFSDLGHARGIAVANTNLGNIARREGNHAVAEGHYLNAIEHAEKQLDEYTASHADNPDPARVSALQVQLANRQCNLALVLQHTDRLDMAAQMTMGALDVYQQAGAHLRLQQAALNAISILGQQDANADLALAGVLARVEAAAAAYQGPLADVIAQHALVARARAERAQDAPADLVLDAYERSLVAGDTLDPALEVEALRACTGILEGRGDLARAHACQQQLLLVSQSGRDVVIVADHSGSMRGKRICAAKECIRALVDSVLRVGLDRGALVRFASKATVAMPLSLVTAAARRELHLAVTEGRVGGRTALWDSLQHALGLWRFDAMTSKRESRQRWIVCLTDGDDTASSQSMEEIKVKLQGQGDISLLLIGVGIQPHYAKILRDVASATPQGMYFAVSGDGGRMEAELSEAFGKVEEIIGGGEHWETT